MENAQETEVHRLSKYGSHATKDRANTENNEAE